MALSTSLPRAVAVLAGARDYYQLPLALYEGEMLESLVTELYLPADRRWFNATLGRVLPQAWLEKRYRAGLDSRRVQVSGRALAAFGWMRMRGHSRLDWYKGAVLSTIARDSALAKNAALFAYSTYAAPAFHTANSRLPYRFLFQMHPHPASARKILADEMERVPRARASLRTEYEFALSQQGYDSLCREPDLANGWVVASSFTAHTLAEHGVPSGRIHVVPYGIDTASFPARTRPPAAGSPFTVICVGSLIQRKGLSYLLDAIRLLGVRKVRVVLCGRGRVDRALLAHYADLALDIKIAVTRAQLVRELHASDVLVLPSLVEGFAHVILEAMACGVPVVTTHHTCAPDVMVDGEHGFIVPVGDAGAIADRIAWGLDHRSDLAGMGVAASRQASEFTWARFRQGIRDAYVQMLMAAA